MSPEQAQGKTLDGRSDLYAVGVLLFHMLTGQAPFTDDDAVVVMAHHIKTVPPPVRSVAPARAIPASLEVLVQRALEKDPVERPQNAETFLAELEKAAEDARRLAAASVSPPTLAPPPASARAAPSRRVVAIAVGVAALLALVAGLASATLRRPGGRVDGVASASTNARPTGGATATAPGAATPRVAGGGPGTTAASASGPGAVGGSARAEVPDGGAAHGAPPTTVAAVDSNTPRSGETLAVADANAPESAPANGGAQPARTRPTARRGSHDAPRGGTGTRHHDNTPYHRWDNN
jgi:serine/threonine-protein kinase